MTKFLVPSAGTYNCRTILNTSRLSVHAFAAAVDINDKQADYWEFLKGRTGTFAWRNRVPGAIGEIFERHGFIWGAKWFHVDSMHFEYPAGTDHSGKARLASAKGWRNIETELGRH